MRADRSHKYMVSMMSVYGSMEMQMFGNILQIFLTIFLSLPWWMGRYVGLLETYIGDYFQESAFLHLGASNLFFHPHIPLGFFYEVQSL